MSESADKRDRRGVDGGAVGRAPARTAGPSVEHELEGDEGDILNWMDRPMEDSSEAMGTEALHMLMREHAEAEHGYGTPAYYAACSY